MRSAITLLLRFEKLVPETGKNGDSTNGGTYSSVGGGWEGEVSHLKGWIKTRVEWMDAQFLTPTFSAPEGEVNKGSRLELTKTGGGTLYFTTDGTDPRLPGEYQPKCKVSKL